MGKNTKTQLVLASASRRRSKILSELGVPFTVINPEVDELIHEDDPQGTVIENALRKNEWSRQRFKNTFILSADTIVEFHGRIVTKPVSAEEASKFLRMLSGQTHRVFTGVAFSRPDFSAEARIDISCVTFKHLSDLMIHDYIRKVNPMDRAGAYDIDENGDLLIESFSGSRTNIMGLSIETVVDLLKPEGLL
ncbi:MAG: Maf family protein [Kiritimatiellae bacterium]|nr:Maf family protein [Kiritimatiellia bacterium]MDD5519358.1 Maf family protein [Kiritimatiellia bacterium]